jgi:hypothetical protein
MRILQASPVDIDQALEWAREFSCEAIAWNLRGDCTKASLAANKANLRSEGWLSVARDVAAAEAHPEWLHAPQHHEWLRRFPEFTSGHPALIGGWIGLNTKAASAHAINKATQLATQNPWMQRLFLTDLQGPPMGCGCGNPCCRSWDNAPGEKLAPTPYLTPEVLFPLVVFRELKKQINAALLPILCPECERGVTIDGVEDPDGPAGTDLCQGIPCVRPCALDYWPRLLSAFRSETPMVGLLTLTEALGKDHAIYGETGWARHAHRHYGTDLLPTVERRDAANFEHCIIATDAPQSCWPVAPPIGYTPEIPPILCGYCPPEG